MKNEIKFDSYRSIFNVSVSVNFTTFSIKATRDFRELSSQIYFGFSYDVKRLISRKMENRAPGAPFCNSCNNVASIIRPAKPMVFILLKYFFNLLISPFSTHFVKKGHGLTKLLDYHVLINPGKKWNCQGTYKLLGRQTMTFWAR